MYSLAAFFIMGATKLCVLHTYRVHLARASPSYRIQVCALPDTCVHFPIDKKADGRDLMLHV